MPALEVNGRVVNFSLNDGAILQDGETLEATLIRASTGKLVVKIGRSLWEFIFSQNGADIELFTANGPLKFRVLSDRDLLLREFRGADPDKGLHADVRAPMPGLVVRVPVERGDRIRKGETVAVLEAMKMENDIRVFHDAEIANVMVKEGDTVEKDQVIATLR